MDPNFRQQFIDRWNRYFPGAELPLAFFYTNQKDAAEPLPPPPEWRCFVCDLKKVRNGKSLLFDVSALACNGAKRYLGFDSSPRENFDYFLSCGIEGELEGERYKKTPELVNRIYEGLPPLKAPARYVVFKRFDRLADEDNPVVVAFFATSDVIAGLFTLANFDEPTPHGVIAPFGAGCAQIAFWPQYEEQQGHPKGVLGLFDISARPCVTGDLLTFSVPWGKFVTMVNNMDESFLTRGQWNIVRKRIARRAQR